MNKIILRCKKVIAAFCIVTPNISAKIVKYGGYDIDRQGWRVGTYKSKTTVKGYDKAGYALNISASAKIGECDWMSHHGVGISTKTSNAYPSKVNAEHCFGLGHGQPDIYGTYWIEN